MKPPPSEYVEPYVEQPSQADVGRIDWEIIHSPLDELGYELWPTGGRLYRLDIIETLHRSNFYDGMRIKNVRTSAAWTVETMWGIQVLRNSWYCLVSVNHKLKRMKISDLKEYSKVKR